MEARAQASANENVAVTMKVTVTDSSGNRVPGATAKDANGTVRGRADSDGKMNVECLGSCQLRVAAAGFATKTVRPTCNTYWPLRAISGNI